MTISQELLTEETLDQAVARRVRGLMGEQRITQQQLATRLGIGKASMSRRLSGEMEFGLSEIPAVAAALNTTEAYLLGFSTDARTPAQRNRTGVKGLEYGIRDSNPEPADSEDSRLADVLPFRFRRLVELPRIPRVGLATVTPITGRVA